MPIDRDNPMVSGKNEDGEYVSLIYLHNFNDE